MTDYARDAASHGGCFPSVGLLRAPWAREDPYIATLAPFIRSLDKAWHFSLAKFPKDRYFNFCARVAEELIKKLLGR